MFYEAFSGTLGVVFAVIILFAIPAFSYMAYKYSKKVKEKGDRPRWNRKDICGASIRTAFSCVVAIICSSIMSGALCVDTEHSFCMFHTMDFVFYPSLILLMFSFIIWIFTIDGI